MGNRRQNRIIELYRDSIVYIQIIKDEKIINGTGFFISHEYIITNYHVIKEAVIDNTTDNKTKVKILRYNEKNNQLIILFAQVLSDKYVNKKQDYAILKLENEYIDKNNNLYNCVFLADEFPYIKDSKLIYFTYKPFKRYHRNSLIWYGNEFIEIKHHESYHLTDNFITLEAKNIIEHGHSGSPIFDKISNTVCGIIAKREGNYPKLAKIIPVETITFPEEVKTSIKNYHNKINLEWLSLLDIYNRYGRIDIKYEALPPDNWLKTLSIPWQNEFYKYLDFPNIEMLSEIVSGKKILSPEKIKRLFTFSRLVINNNNIKTLEPLKNFIYLKILIINNTQINNIKPIENLYALEQLDLSDNMYLSDVKELKYFDNLRDLDLSNTAITSIEEIFENSKLKKLTRLTLDNTKISSLKNISSLPNLTHLNLKNIQINKIEDLIKHEKLKYLTCKCNEKHFEELLYSRETPINISLDGSFVNKENIKIIWNNYKENEPLAEVYDYEFY